MTRIDSSKPGFTPVDTENETGTVCPEGVAAAGPVDTIEAEATLTPAFLLQPGSMHMLKEWHSGASEEAHGDGRPHFEPGEIETKKVTFDRQAAWFERKGVLASTDGEVNASIAVGQARVHGELSLVGNVRKGEVGVRAAGSAGVYAASAHLDGQSHLGEVTIGAATDAMVGAELNGGLQTGYSKKEGGFVAEAGAGLTLARVESTAKAEVDGLGVVATGGVEFGLIGQASLKAGFHDGKFEAHARAAVAFGVGEHASVAVEVDPKELTEKLGKPVERLFEKGLDAAEAASDAVQATARGLVDDHFGLVLRARNAFER